ncbi:MAG TPA: hypothetical protein VH257_05890 [Chloroflexota bacterium]|nr:hypothetical protein [Chloroflexota bacterium]
MGGMGTPSGGPPAPARGQDGGRGFGLPPPDPRAAGAASDAYTIDGRPFVGIQIGAVSFVDEGTADVLDLLRERAGVNAVLLACHTFHRNLARTIFGDARPEASLELMYGILGVDEAPLDALPATAWSAEYVRRETVRAVTGAGPGVAILPGIDIDVPTGEGQTRCTPEGTREAVKAAFAGGARGVILSRKYSEMRLANLFAVQEALAR